MYLIIKFMNPENVAALEVFRWEKLTDELQRKQERKEIYVELVDNLAGLKEQMPEMFWDTNIEAFIENLQVMCEWKNKNIKTIKYYYETLNDYKRNFHLYFWEDTDIPMAFIRLHDEIEALYQNVYQEVHPSVSSYYVEQMKQRVIDIF